MKVQKIVDGEVLHNLKVRGLQVLRTDQHCHMSSEVVHQEIKIIELNVILMKLI